MTPEVIDVAPAAAPETELVHEDDPETIRGRCPQCGAPVRSRLYYVNGRGYFSVWECDNASPQAPDDPVCEFRRVL